MRSPTEKRSPSGLRTAGFLGGLVALALVVTACINPYVVTCENQAKDPEKGEWKYTEKQAITACDYSHLLVNSELAKFDEETKTWEINYGAISIADVASVLEDQAASLDTYLSYQNRAFSDFIDAHRRKNGKSLRAGLEEEENIIQERLRRLAIAQVFSDFAEKVGKPSQKEDGADAEKTPLGYFFPDGLKKFSMRLFYEHPEVRLGDLPFTASYLDQAKQNGTLVLVERLERSGMQVYARQVPSLTDANNLTWEDQKRGWVILGYKIVRPGEVPVDKTVHYIEVYRKKPDLSGEESLPAVRGFLPNGGDTVSVFLIDYDRERKGGTHDVGYGSPDEVWQTFGTIKSAAEIESDNIYRGKLLEPLYELPKGTLRVDRTRPERRAPKDLPIYLAIKRMGEVSLDIWEKGSWSVPFPYQNEKGLTRSLRIDEEPFEPDPKLEKEELKKFFKDGKPLKQIKFLVRETSRNSDKIVVEYWLPKAEYAKRNIVEMSAFSGISLLRNGEFKREGAFDLFAGTLVQVDYKFGGRWFRIVDEADADGKEGRDGVFEKKREIPESQTRANADSASKSTSLYSVSPYGN